MDDRAIRRLVDAAIRAAEFAHAPYSRFHVGAALLTRTGKIVSGCNVENASYGLTICAERNAIFAAVARNYRSFKAIAITADARMPYPCGACRQVLSEFCDTRMPVFIAPLKTPRAVQRFTLGELLPHQFKM